MADFIFNNLSNPLPVFINKLSKSGDINQSEVIRAKKSLNDAEKQFVMQKNQSLFDLFRRNL